jgi:hypothetical protein
VPSAKASAMARYAVALEQPVSCRIASTITGIESPSGGQPGRQIAKFAQFPDTVGSKAHGPRAKRRRTAVAIRHGGGGHNIND